MPFQSVILYGWWDDTADRFVGLPEKAEAARKAGHRLTTLYSRFSGSEPKVLIPKVRPWACTYCGIGEGEYHRPGCPDGSVP